MQNYIVPLNIFTDVVQKKRKMVWLPYASFYFLIIRFPKLFAYTYMRKKRNYFVEELPSSSKQKMVAIDFGNCNSSNRVLEIVTKLCK